MWTVSGWIPDATSPYSKAMRPEERSSVRISRTRPKFWLYTVIDTASRCADVERSVGDS